MPYGNLVGLLEVNLPSDLVPLEFLTLRLKHSAPSGACQLQLRVRYPNAFPPAGFACDLYSGKPCFPVFACLRLRTIGSCGLSWVRSSHTNPRRIVSFLVNSFMLVIRIECTLPGSLYAEPETRSINSLSIKLFSINPWVCYLER